MTQTTYEFQDQQAFAFVDRLGLAATTGEKPEPEMFTVGQVCVIMHKSKTKECTQRHEMDSEPVPTEE